MYVYMYIYIYIYITPMNQLSHSNDPIIAQMFMLNNLSHCNEPLITHPIVMQMYAEPLQLSQFDTYLHMIMQIHNHNWYNCGIFQMNLISHLLETFITSPESMITRYKTHISLIWLLFFGRTFESIITSEQVIVNA